MRKWTSWNPYTLLVGTLNGAATLETVGQCLKKLNIELPYDPTILLLGVYPKEMKIYVHTKLCKQMFRAVLFRKAQRWKELKFSTDEWISEMWYIHTMECYSALKRNEVLTHAATWMNLETVC